MSELYPNEIKQAIRDLVKEQALNVTSADVQNVKKKMISKAYKDSKTKMLDYLEELEDLYSIKEGKVHGIKTGVKGIDDAIGILKNNELMVLGGASGAGKSLIATNIMAKLIKEGKNVIYVGLEMGFGATFERLASIIAGIEPQFFRGYYNNSKAIENGYSEMLKFCEFMKSKKNWQILTFNEFDTPTASNIMATCKAIQENLGWKRIDLIIIDYLQYIPCVDGKTEYETANETIQQLKTFVVCEKMPVLALSSLSADGSLKGTTAIKFTSDFALMVNPIPNSNDRCLAVVKNRYGNFMQEKIAYSNTLQIIEKGNM